MIDRKIHLDSAIAGGAWVAATVLLVVMWVSKDPRWGATSIVMTGVAATVTVRAFIIQQCLSLRNAFELGRDARAPTRLQSR